MSHRLRRLIFYTFLLIFLAITPCILLYAQGYSFDWQKKSLDKTGALYVRSYPKNISVYVDGKARDKTPCLIKRLSPGKYQVTLKAPGFYTWQKTLAISENLVTEAREIIMVPKNPSLELTLLEESINQFSLSSEGKKMIYFNQNKQQIFYLDLKNRLQQYLYNSPQTIQIMSWSPDNNKVLIKQNDDWQIIDLTEFKILHLRPAGQQSLIQKIAWHPFNKNQIFFMQNDQLYLRDYTKQETSQKIAEDIFDFTISNNLLLFVKKPGYFLYQSDLLGDRQQQLSLRPIFKEGQEIKLDTSNNNQISLIIDNALYLFNQDKRLFELTHENVKQAIFSSDNKKLLIVTRNEIWVLYLEEQKSQPRKQAGQKDLITRLSQEIIQAMWHPYDNSHLIFTTGDKIKIAEIDDRDQIYLVDFLTAQNPQIQHSTKTKQLYFTNDQKLFSVKIP